VTSEWSSPVLQKRHVNDRIHESLGSEPKKIGFFCECPRADCFRIVWLSGAQFADARSQPTWAVLDVSHGGARRPVLAS
jgi:hypothetical protein